MRVKWLLAAGLIFAGIQLLPSSGAANEKGGDEELNSVGGTWLSNWGVVVLNAEPTANGEQIRGSILQNVGETGVINDGSYDKASRRLTFSFHQNWNHKDGNATLTLSSDGRELSGNWRTNGGKGDYKLQLLFRGKPPSARQLRAQMEPVSSKHRLEVLPVIFIPNDCKWAGQKEVDLFSYLLVSHLILAQQHYKSLLKTDTFKIAAEPLIYHGKESNDFYVEALKDDHEPEAGHLITKEQLDAKHDDRHSNRYVYVTVFVRSKPRPKGGPYFGGGRPFNGRPNTGGGSLELEVSSLLADEPFFFQAAINHELGHTFGLVHPDAYGYDLRNNESNMSYDPRITSHGLNPVIGGRFNPEEYLVLSQNKLAFPDFRFVASEHNPKGKQLKASYLGAMSDYIGDRRNNHGVRSLHYPCPSE